MLKRPIHLALALVFPAHVVPAATIQLKDKAAVTGKILAEKKDQLVVDVGYTVLIIPRNQVAKVIEDDAVPTVTVTKATSKTVVSASISVSVSVTNR